jgi:alpha-1,6-mannosyltransferase
VREAVSHCELGTDGNSGAALRGNGNIGNGVSPMLGMVSLVLIALVAVGAQHIEHYDFRAYVISALVHGLFYLAAVWWICNKPPRARDLAVILAAAFVLRGIAMTAPAHLTTDGLRYVWDGRIQWAGFNPYLWVPADGRLAGLRDAVIYPNLNQKETAVTIYPPVAQMLFLIGNWLSDSVRGIQAVMAAADMVTIWALLAWLKADNQPRERVLIYAWHPIPTWEFCGMAHIDSAATALLMLTIVAVVRGRQGVAGGLLAAAVLTKYFPLVLAPALWRRWGWRMPVAFVVAAAILYAPYAADAGLGVLGFLGGFHIVWILRDYGLWAPSGRSYVAIALLVLGALGVWTVACRRADQVRPAHLVLLAAAYTFATSPHYAWYFGWVIPLLARHLSPAVLGVTLLALLQNLPGNATWLTQTWFYTTIFGGFAALAVAESAWRWRRRTAPRAADGRRGGCVERTLNTLSTPKAQSMTLRT